MENLPDTKFGEISDWRYFGNRKCPDYRSGRPLLYPVNKSFEVLRFAFSFHFNFSIRSIAHPAGDL